MNQRLVISDNLKQFFVEYFDEESHYLIDFFCTKKSTSEIAKEATMDKRRMIKKLSGMIAELMHIIQELK